jgi:AcrR family transcriptional regulator
MEPADRERLLDALLVELAEKGYREMALADSLRLCGVSNTAFEAELVDKDTALFAAYDQLTERLRRRAAEACAGAGGAWPQRVHAGLQALLDELGADPRAAFVLIRAFPAISPEARARYQEFVEEFAPMLREGREFVERGEELPAEVEMFAVGAAETIVFEEIEAGRATALPALGPEILFSVLVPFLGPEAASAEMETAKQLG